MKQQVTVRAVVNLPEGKESCHEMLVIMKKLVDAAADFEAKAERSDVRDAMKPVSDMLCEIMFEVEAARSLAYAQT